MKLGYVRKDPGPPDLEERSAFAFVDGLENTYRTKAVRSHVMSNVYRAKNKQSAHNSRVLKSWTFEAAQPESLSGQVNTLPSQEDMYMVPSNLIKPWREFEMGLKGSIMASDGSATAEKAKYQLIRHMINHPSMQPRSILGNERFDPFSTLPVPRSAAVDEFLAYYLGPADDYGIGIKRATAFNYRLSRFRAALDDECSFYAMLIRLRRRAMMTGNQATANHAVQFQVKCLQLMTERLSRHQAEGSKIDSGTLYGALDISNAEMRSGEIELSKLHWQGLANMIIKNGGLYSIVPHTPLVFSVIWNYMVLGLDQGIQWDYIPANAEIEVPSLSAYQKTCGKELLSFISRLENVETRRFLQHSVIIYAVSPGTLLHLALCSTNGYTCKLSSRFRPRFQAINPAYTNQHATKIRNMQSPRPGILIFLLSILMEINTNTDEDCLNLTLTHFFTSCEKAFHNIDFDRYPEDVETILMILIRGINLNTVFCPGSSTLGLCSLHKDASKMSKYPDWPLVFTVMRIMGGMRMLSQATRRTLILKIRNVFTPNDCSTSVQQSLIDCGQDPQRYTPWQSPPLDLIEEPTLNDLKAQICLELGYHSSQ